MNQAAELFELWREIRLGAPANLSNPDLRIIQQAWRSTDDFRRRTIATIRACNAIGPGLWEDLCRAGLDAITRADQRHSAQIDAIDARIAAAESQALAGAMRRQRADLAWKAGATLSEAWGLET